MSTVPIAIEAFRTRCALVVRPRGFVEVHDGRFSYDTRPSGNLVAAKCAPIQRHQSTLSASSRSIFRRDESSIGHGSHSRGRRAYWGDNSGSPSQYAKRDEAIRSGASAYAQRNDNYRHARKERSKISPGCTAVREAIDSVRLDSTTRIEKYEHTPMVADRHEVYGQESGSIDTSRNLGQAATISTSVLAPPSLRSEPSHHSFKDISSATMQYIRSMLTVADTSPPAPPPISYVRYYRRREKRLRMSEAVDQSHEHNLDEEITYDEQQMEREILDAVSTGNPQVVLRYLDSRSRYKEFDLVLAKLPRSTFSEMLRCLDPEHFLGSYQRRSREINPQAYKQLFRGSDDDYHTFTSTYISRLWMILRARLKSTSISLSDLRNLLKSARVTGDVKFARFLWKNFTTEGQGSIRPDVTCYNNLMATICWSDVVAGGSRYRLRIIGYNIASRTKLENETEAQSHPGHRVGGPQGIKNQVSDLFRSMLVSGLAGDEETFCHMMIAFAREADLKSVEAILRRVWNIDVLELLKNPEFEHAPKAYPKDSPFHPSENMLMAVAHAYGINNAIPVALRLVDYISRQYSLVIPISVWTELLNWTYVLSVPRRKKSSPDSRPRQIGVDLDYTTVLDDPEIIVTASETTGQLPPEAVTNLWNTMTSEPYNIKPTLALYNRAINNLLNRQQFGHAQRLMKESTQCHIESVQKLGRVIADVEATVPKQGRDELHQSRIRERNFLHMEVRLGRYYRRGWVRKLLKLGERNMRHRNPDWYCRGIPHILDEWSSYLPARIKYATPTGDVTIWTGSVNLNRYRVWNLCCGRNSRKSLQPVPRPYLTLPPHRRSIVGLMGQRDGMNRDMVRKLEERRKTAAVRRQKSTMLEEANQDEGAIG